MADTQQLYEQLIAELKQTALLASCSSLLSWDEQTYLPAGGSEHRAAQMSLLAGLVHERATSPRVGEILSFLEASGELGDAHAPMNVNVREARRQFDRVTKLPRRLVEELSRVTSLSQRAWVEARKASDFSKFRPWLEQIIGLNREVAEAIGYGDGAPYDALLDEYEPGEKTARLVDVFTPLRDELVEFVTAIRESGRQPDVSILARRFPQQAQQEFATLAARAIGFDFDEGRLDETAHPMCCGIGPGDCRLTTRYDEHHFPGAFFGVLHEAGHGLYEQGLDRSAFGTPMGDTVSLGIHESQSLLWENFVGRGKAFWSYFFAQAQQAFPEALGDVELDLFYRAVNDVRPSWIRVEADQVTYNLHIMLRFDLERALLDGDLQPADVPVAWNEGFDRYFDMTPPDDALGCLQDIHWSAGLVGYFPTYTLGHLNAAQLYAKAREDLGDLDEQISRGEFSPLKHWLTENVHRPGKQYTSPELIELVTGRALSHEPLMTHLHSKFGELYGL